MSLRSLLLLVAATAATPAFADEDRRELCPDRPGLGTPACTVEPGALMFEIGLADWTLDRTADSRSDSWTFGDALLRAGLTPSLEVQLGWTMLGHARERDRATGEVTRRTRTGDVTIATRLAIQSTWAQQRARLTQSTSRSISAADSRFLSRSTRAIAVDRMSK